MGYFPFFVDLTGAPGLVVGGGEVALRKVEKLLPYGPALTVAAPRICPRLREMPGLALAERRFRPEDLEGMAFAIAATDDPAVDHEVAGLCRRRSIPVNVVDDPGACSFLFPALVKRGDLSIGISTGGASPTAAKYLKEQISAVLPEGLEEILAYLNALRPELKARVPEARRGALYAELFRACMDLGRPLDEAELETVLRERGGMPS